MSNCSTGKSGDHLDSREQTCLSNCVDRCAAIISFVEV